MNITNILTEAVGDDKNHQTGKDLPFENSPEIYGNQRIVAYANGYNRAKAELRAKIPAIQEEIVKEIVNWAKKRCEDNKRVFGTDKWNSDLEDLINKLSKK
jgi:hypothetical protein